jgi:F-type H+-transporting ATPase subunit c
MNKWIRCALMMMAPVGVAFAAEAVKLPHGVTFFGATVLAAGVGVGLAAGGCGVGMGLVIASALQGMARQPELQSRLQLNMLIGFALIEAQVLYALFIAIILLFANPFTKLIG